MSRLGVKQKLEEVIEVLPQSKLETVLHFASYLREQEQPGDLLKWQMSSAAYHEWLSTDNDIYDEVFQDEAKAG